MADSFFIGGGRKRKSNSKSSQPFPNAKRGRRQANNATLEDEEEETVGAFDVDDAVVTNGNDEEEEDASDDETAAEKRIRIAKKYLDHLGKHVDEGDVDAVEIDRQNIASRLQQEALATTGRLKLTIADSVAASLNIASVKVFKGHRESVTAVAITSDEKFVFSASKDASIIKWDLETGKKLAVFSGRNHSDSSTYHINHILALAVSSDGRYLASGGLDKIIHIWDLSTNKHHLSFKQHRGPVSGLVFRHGSHQLYSCSHDRTLKIWDIDQQAYIETLFGHQEVATSIDALGPRERCVSAGGRDRTARLWKISEESQLVFRGHVGSMDVIRLINDETFASGDDEGSICLWNINKKKPTVNATLAHGAGHWIISLAAFPYSDLLASGSSDGFIRLWKIEEKKITQVAQIEQAGFVNSLQFSTSGKSLIVGVGQEHRLGRWQRNASTKNVVRVIAIDFDKFAKVNEEASKEPAIDTTATTTTTINGNITTNITNNIHAKNKAVSNASKKKSKNKNNNNQKATSSGQNGFRLL